MKGLVIKFGGMACKAGIPDNGVSLIVNVTQWDGAFWTVGGFKMPEDVHLTWNGGTLKVGDIIEIEFAEFDEASTPAVEEKHSCISDKSLIDTGSPDIWKRKLETYYRLKKVLEEENII